jgi:hypothetical protein
MDGSTISKQILRKQSLKFWNRNVHVSHVRVVGPANTLNSPPKKCYFYKSVVRHTLEHRTGQIDSQPGVIMSDWFCVFQCMEYL